MYVVRPALRASTGRPPARYVCGRRYPSTTRVRPLHTSPTLARASNPPSTPGDTPIDQHGPDANDSKEAVAATAEQTEASITNEDPEVLAQKLQRSRENSRRYSAALRRQQRGKKATGFPPVHIPDWFLKKRVLRCEDQLREHDAKGLPILSVSVSHADSGEHATCSIPAGIDFDAADVLSRLMRGLWTRRLDDQERRRVEKYLQENMTGSLQAQAQDLLERLAITAPTLHESEAATESSSSKDYLPHHIETLIGKLQSSDATAQDVRDTESNSLRVAKAAKKRSIFKSKQVGASRRISPLVVAEFRSTVAASLSTLRPSSGDSFPSAKTNVILYSPSPNHESSLDRMVQSTASEMGADVVVLHAQDLAQLGGDYLGEATEPSPRSIRSLGYETYRLSTDLHDSFTALEEAPDDETDPNPSSSAESALSPLGLPRLITIPLFASPPALKALLSNSLGKSMSMSTPYDASSVVGNDDASKQQSHSDLQLEDLKIAVLLEMLMDSNELKHQRGLVGPGIIGQSQLPDGSQTRSKPIAFFDYSLNSQGIELELNSALPDNAKATISMSVKATTLPHPLGTKPRSKIIYVKDFKEMNTTHYGGRILQKLEELVRKRRASGESIVIVGSTCSRVFTPNLHANGVRGLQGEGESGLYRTIVAAAETHNNEASLALSLVSAQFGPRSSEVTFAEKSKFRRINLLHIQDMLHSLDPNVTASIANMEQSPQSFRSWHSIFPSASFDRVYTYDEVHRIALTAIGLYRTSLASENVGEEAPQLNWAHVALAIGLLHASDMTKCMFFEKMREAEKSQNPSAAMESQIDGKTKAAKHVDEKNIRRQRELARIASTANKHEKRLIPGIADPDQIKTTFDQVHVPKETVESIRTITSLSLLRPEAFSYGILATEKISGALLYGPPGTGKTLLAKAVAKESGSTVLEVSGSQILDKYVGESEKNVAAIFSLARKLSPCIVFLDEADAVFASRDAMRDRMSHRDTLNQFLKEWDGLNDLSVFVMVATNRPFDLDDAVIRRLPRRLLVDLPTQEDRREILKIHLKGEQLDDAVDLEDLAKRTPFYSGSDLKNVVISAALACVKEENEEAARAAAGSSSDNRPAVVESPSSSPSSAPSQNIPHLARGQTYKFPERRTLHKRHFDKALQEISASISEDMSSLSAIKKFDEQYGDRKGNKRRKDFGFGVLTERNENAARVRT